MQFLVTVSIVQHAGAPPDELQSVMTNFVHDETRAGTFVITGGLAERAAGVCLQVSSSGPVRSDSRLPFDGFAVVECSALDQAIEVAARILRSHQEFVPDWQVECEVRQIVTDCLP